MAKPPSGSVLDTGNALYTNITNAWGLLEGSGSTCADSKGGNTATFHGGGISWGSDAEGPYVETTDGTSWLDLASNVTIPINTSFTIAWGAKGQTDSSNSNMLCGDITSGADYWWHHVGNALSVNNPLLGNTGLT